MALSKPIEQTDVLSPSFSNLKSEIKIPETEDEIKRIHQLLIDLVLELNKKDNIDGFQRASEAFFKQFGIEPGDDDDSLESNMRSTYFAYTIWQNHLKWRKDRNSADVQIYGKDGIYANISLNEEKLIDGRRIVLVSPGACSIPQPIHSPANNKHGIQDISFYKTMEIIFGIDYFLRERGTLASLFDDNPHVLNDESQQKCFFVEDGKKVQLPVRDFKTQILPLVLKK